MGGLVFKEKSRRIKKEELPYYRNKIFNILDKFDLEYKEILSYKNKEDFGDLDILVKKDCYINIINKLKNYFKDNNIEYSQNSNILSFLIEELQVDLIFTKARYFESSYYYFKNSDLGNLIGRISHKLGIKWGHKGISIVLRDSSNIDANNIIAEIELSQDINEILDILGLDKEIYHEGFDDLEDIFKYVISSKYFNKCLYAYENRNHYARTRDKKRKTYREFLKYIEENDIPDNYIYDDTNNRGGYNIREPFFSEIVLVKFPWVIDKIKEITEEYENKKLERREFLEKFNIKEIENELDIHGKELGMYIKFLKDNKAMEVESHTKLYNSYKKFNDKG
jgi:hypothetical protein